MSFHAMKKLAALAATAAVVVLLLNASTLYAQRDAGAKARGDMSPFWSQPSHMGSAARMYSAPRATVETRESYSYEPAESGDAPVVKKQATGGCSCHHHAAKDNAVAAAPQTERRSFSYEPSMSSAPRSSGHHHSAAPNKAQWQYQKADPRRDF